MINLAELDKQSLKILAIIWRAPDKELQWKMILARMPKTSLKDKRYKSRSAPVILQRKLTKLFGQRILERRREERKTYYYIPKRLWPEAEKAIKRLELFDVPNKMLSILHNIMNRMALEGIDPEVFFQENCIAFIGSTPCTFLKTQEGMKDWLEFENDVERRALKKGLQKEAYFEKILAQAAREGGDRGIRTLYGLAEEDT